MVPEEESVSVVCYPDSLQVCAWLLAEVVFGVMPVC